MCGTRLADNAGPKKIAQNCHLGTIAQFFGLYVLQMSPQYGEHHPLTAEIGWQVWGTPANYNRFSVLAALLHGTLVLGIS